MNLEHKQMDLFETERPRKHIQKYVCAAPCSRKYNTRCARYTADDLIDRPNECPEGKTPIWVKKRG